MKSNLKFLILLILITVSGIFFILVYNSFDKNEADKPVRLTSTDFENYEELAVTILSDLPIIRKQVINLTSGDTTFLNTNSYYLYQINKSKYKPLISKLQKKNIFIDDICTTPNGTLYFTLKDETDNGNLPHLQYCHKLVYGGIATGFSDIIIDSVINNKWKYIYYSAAVGH